MSAPTPTTNGARAPLPTLGSGVLPNDPPGHVDVPIASLHRSRHTAKLATGEPPQVTIDPARLADLETVDDAVLRVALRSAHGFVDACTIAYELDRRASAVLGPKRPAHRPRLAASERRRHRLAMRFTASERRAIDRAYAETRFARTSDGRGRGKWIRSLLLPSIDAANAEDAARVAGVDLADYTGEDGAQVVRFADAPVDQPLSYNLSVRLNDAELDEVDALVAMWGTTRTRWVRGVVLRAVLGM
jgi:hypothetical protein